MPGVMSSEQVGHVYRALVLLEATDTANLAGTAALIGKARQPLWAALAPGVLEQAANPQREKEEVPA